MNMSELKRPGISCLAVASRISLLSAICLFVVACASKNYNEPAFTETAASAEAEMPEAEQFAMDRAVDPTDVDFETIATRDANGVEIQTAAVSGAQFFLIDPGVDSAAFETQELESPKRFVLDIPGASVTKIDSISTENSGIERIRIGGDETKARLVFDLSSENNNSFTASRSEDGRILVESRNTAIQTGNETPELKAETITEEKTIVADTLKPASEKIASTNSLRSLRFGNLSNGEGDLVAEMSSAGIFEIQKTAPSEYVVRLEKAKPAPQVSKTLMAEAGSAGIKAVRVTEEGEDTLIRIFTSPEFELNAQAKRGSIHVLAQSTLADARAQLADEEEDAEEVVEEEIDELAVEDEVSALLDEAPKYTGRLISLDLQDTDIDNALRIIAEVSNLNIIASDDVAGKVTLRLIDVPWDQALDVILKTNGLDKVREGNVVRIAPVDKLRQERENLRDARRAEEELEPLQVRYFRVSYARASELRSLVESVLSERGTVATDERTNQLIVRDIRRGVVNTAELVNKLDLRTPQVLLETQIVEATRSFGRELGSDLSYNFLQTPETGNATGYNFPNSITTEAGSTFAANPASFVNVVLDSADGTRSLSAALTAAENEGTARVVSRPAVVTTNNTAATIKSVEKIRIKTPQGGVSVATGAGAQSAGSGGIATETFEVGITLDVTPQASPDYFVLLDIAAKSSTLGAEVVDGIPSEIERSANSTVLVSSGQTFAIGGIYSVNDSTSNEGVPFLKDVPVLGTFFRRNIVDNSDEELIFFITPRIVEGSFDDAAMQIGS